MILQSHIKAVFPRFRPQRFTGQAVYLLQHIPLLLQSFFPGQSLLPALIGFFKQGKPLFIDPVVGNIPPGIPKISLIALRLCQKALLNELLQINKIWISRKRGKGLIRRIPISGRPKGKDLPDALSRLFQAVDPFICFL